jgi:hypothetical protein
LAVRDESDEDATTSDRLTFRWGGDDGDGVGKLTVAARANGFAGVAGAWFDRETVLIFARSIDSYPLPDDPIEISGGFGAKGDEPAQEHVGIQVSRVGIRGQVGIRAHLSTELRPDTRRESVHQVWLELLTTYENLRFLSRHLALLIEGRLDVAEIDGDILA